MSIIASQRKQDSDSAVVGTYGVFKTLEGKVNYLLTNARIDPGSTDLSAKLTAKLLPVREILNTSTLNFSELLQRDLDDHRVASSLIPYIFGVSKDSAKTGPAYFPPIVAALLPFEDEEPKSRFPPVESEEALQSDRGFNLKRKWYGDAYSFAPALTLNDKDKYVPMRDLSLGELVWNEQKAKLVVLDGQHRAMALIAIARTISKQWDKVNKGSTYQSFYKPGIERLLRENEGAKEALKKLEFPVNFIWFTQDEQDADFDHHKAARKLFVDVNKNARTPSPSRLILLSDSELTAIFSREVLNRIRVNEDLIHKTPIAAIEYDQRGRQTSSPAKWSAMINLETINQVVKNLMFGPESYFQHFDKQGLAKEAIEDYYFRAQLDVDDWMDPEVVDGDQIIRRRDFGNKCFPQNHLPKIVELFNESWGEAIVTVTSNLSPYKEHAKALKESQDYWVATDNVAKLARDAVFEGVGMYWTLKSAADSWRRDEREDNRGGQPDIIKAWRMTEEFQNEFQVKRAGYYFDKKAPNEELVKLTNEVFAKTNTHAAFGGVMLLVGGLCYRKDIKGSDVVKVAAAVCECINDSLEQNKGKKYDRRKVFLSKEHKNPFNRIPKMDRMNTLDFRTIWMELLASSEKIEEVFGELEIKKEHINKYVAETRRRYLNIILNNKMKSLKDDILGLSEQELKIKAQGKARKEHEFLLKHWFGLGSADYDSWINEHSPFPKEPEPSSVEDDSEAQVLDDAVDSESESTD